MSDPKLIGRTAELAALDAQVNRTGDSGPVLVVLGEPGIGKTSLLRTTRASAEQSGFRVLTGVGVEAEAQLPFAGLHQMLTPILDLVDDLPAEHGNGLRTAFGIEDGPRPELYLIAEAVLQLITATSERGGVLVLADDVQWLDPQTQEVLAFLGHRLRTPSVSVIGAARIGHRGPFFEAAFPTLVVTGVDDDSAAAILAVHAQELPAAERSRIQREASGNPLALIELPRTSHEGGPVGSGQSLSRRLERAFAGRVTELPRETKDALLIAAVDHADDLAEVLAAATALTGAAVGAEVLEPAVDIGLVTVEDGCVGFRHPLIRSAVLQRETPARRQAANGALAAVLRDQPYRRSWHLAESIVGPDDDVADELEAVVADALARGAVLTAVSTLERSAQLTSSSGLRGHRLLVAAEHAFGLGRADLVNRLVAEAGRTDLGELDRARMEWLHEIFNDGVPGDGARVMELCNIARRSAEFGDLDLALNLLLGAALRCWWADSGVVARSRVAEVLDELDHAAKDPRHLAALAVAEPVLRGADVVARLDRLRADAVTDADALRLLGMAAHAVGDTTRATDFLDRAERELRVQARLGLLPHVLGMQANIRLELGDWAGAADAAREVYQLSVETGQPIWTLGNITCDARALALRGQWQRALELVTEAELIATRQRLNDALCLAQMARGTALIAADRHGEAYTALSRLFDPIDPSYHQREGFAGLTFLAEAAARSGYVDEARGIVGRLEEVGRTTPSPILHVHLAYARAVLAPDAEAEQLYLDALAVDLTRWPWARARLELAFGQFLVRHGRLDVAADHLQSARDRFQEIGATAWERQSMSALALVQATKGQR